MHPVDFMEPFWRRVGWNRWIVVVGAVMVQLALGSIYSWGTMTLFISYPGYVEASMGETVFIFALGLASFGCFIMPAGLLQQRIGPMVTCLLGGIVMSAGVLLSSLAKTWHALLVTYGLLFGCGIALSYVCPIACSALWFPEMKGTINGIAVAGFGAGAFIFNFLIKALANPENLATGGDRTKWSKERALHFHESMQKNVPRMFLVLGIICAIMIILGSLTLRVPPKAMAALKRRGTEVRTQGNAWSNVDVARTFTWVDTIQTRHFWLVWGSFMLSAISGLMVIGVFGTFGSKAVPALRAPGKLQSGTIALLGGLGALMNALGRIVWGHSCDRFGYSRTLMTMLSVQSVAMFLYVVSGKHVASFSIVTMILFFCFGGNFSIFPTVTSDLFGAANLGSNYGVVFTAYGVAGVLGATLVKFAKSQYVIIFPVMGALSLCSLSCAVCLYKLKPPQNVGAVQREMERRKLEQAETRKLGPSTDVSVKILSAEASGKVSQPTQQQDVCAVSRLSVDVSERNDLANTPTVIRGTSPVPVPRFRRQHSWTHAEVTAILASVDYHEFWNRPQSSSVVSAMYPYPTPRHAQRKKSPDSAGLVTAMMPATPEHKGKMMGASFFTNRTPSSLTPSPPPSLPTSLDNSLRGAGAVRLHEARHIKPLSKAQEQEPASVNATAEGPVNSSSNNNNLNNNDNINHPDGSSGSKNKEEQAKVVDEQEEEVVDLVVTFEPQ